MGFLDSLKKAANKKVNEQGKRADRLQKQHGDKMSDAGRAKADKFAEYKDKDYFKTNDK